MDLTLPRSLGPLRALLAPVALAALLAANAPPHADPVPVPEIAVLLFHQVSANPITTAAGEDTIKKPWVTPAEFDATLGAAERQGFRPIGLDAALAFFEGRRPATALPPKPLLITFDDGYASAWTDATPVLRAHHASATMFFEGQLTDTKPGRLTTAQLRAMAASGVWALQSHGYVGHGNIVVDANGTRNPYWYANLMWLPAQHRLETPDEFETRVRADAHRFRAQFESVTGAPIHVFAYPSGEFGQNDALAAGGDPRAKLEAGHSNAAGLYPRLVHALRAEGFDAAFAVSIPGRVTLASRADDVFAIPRVGVGAGWDPAVLAALEAPGIPLPEIVHDRFADPGPLAATPDGFFVATSAAPELFRLDVNGRVVGTYAIDALLDDRRGQPSLASGLVADGDDVTIVQQAGWWPGGKPQLTRVHVDATGAHVVDRHPLPAAMNWLVGLARDGARTVAMTDDGTFFDLATATPLARIALAAAEKRQGRFAGPVVLDGRLAAIDRTLHRLVAVDAAGAIVREIALPGDLVTVAAHDDRLFAVDASGKRHVLLAWHVAS